jgi:hypothetical protein
MAGMASVVTLLFQTTVASGNGRIFLDAVVVSQKP